MPIGSAPKPNDRESILPPEGEAEKNFSSFIGLEFIQRKFSELRKDIRALKAPGESYVFSSSQDTDVTEPLSRDEKRGGYRRQATITNYYLVVGARKIERGHFGDYYKYNGGEELYLFGGEGARTPVETPEELKAEMLANRQEQIKDDFAREKKIIPPSNASAADWTKAYDARWDALQQLTEEKWRMEDDQLLAEKKAIWDAYEAMAERVRHAREESTKAVKRAENLRINLREIEGLFNIDIGGDSIESLEENVLALEAYVKKVNILVEQILHNSGEKDFPDAGSLERALEVTPTPAKWHLRDIDPKIFEAYGRKLGEGFGEKVAGKLLYLPGDRAVVGISIPGSRRRRYSTEIETFDLSPLGGRRERSIPSIVPKDGAELIAIVDSPDWKAKWIKSHDGLAYAYTLANSKGIGEIYYDGTSISQYLSADWENLEGQGPTLGEICAAFGIKPNIDSRVTEEIETQKKEEASNTQISDKEKAKENVLEVTFVDKGGRNFQCGNCQYMERLGKGDYARYKNGEAIDITCPNCHGTSKLQINK